jgi:hypothetical protein
MREFRTYGSVRGALGNGRSYRDQMLLVSEARAGGWGVVLTPSWDRDPPSACWVVARSRLSGPSKIGPLP